jgi:hypothetical protein
MASNPAPPALFDRALLKQRQERARKSGPATFLLDRVAEDFGDRLQAVTRNGCAVQSPIGSNPSGASIWPPTAKTWRSRRNPSISPSPRWRFNSSMICPACLRKSVARCGLTGCCLRR